MSRTGLSLTSQGGAPGSLAADVQDVFDLVNAELTLSETGGELTADGTEQDIYVNLNPLGEFRPVCVFVNLDNMQAGNTTVFRVYYQIGDGLGFDQQYYASYTGVDGGLANGNKLIVIDLYPNRFGIQVTLQETAGVNRTYEYEVHVEA